jgi:hypothetical protein
LNPRIPDSRRLNIEEHLGVIVETKLWEQGRKCKPGLDLESYAGETENIEVTGTSGRPGKIEVTLKAQGAVLRYFRSVVECLRTQGNNQRSGLVNFPLDLVHLVPLFI